MTYKKLTIFKLKLISTINPIYLKALITFFCILDVRGLLLLGIVFVNSPGDLGSIPGQVIPKTSKMVLDISLLNTQQYKGTYRG